MATSVEFALTKPERAVYGALKKLGVSFDVQTPMMGGRQVRGGTVVDFYLRDWRIIISVIGLYWHLKLSTRARDWLQKIALGSRGVKVIYIDEDDANRNADYYVREAIEGRDWSTYAGII